MASAPASVAENHLSFAHCGIDIDGGFAVIDDTGQMIDSGIIRSICYHADDWSVFAVIDQTGRAFPFARGAVVMTYPNGMISVDNGCQTLIFGLNRLLS